MMEFHLGGHLQSAGKLADESWDFCSRMKLLYPLAPLARIKGVLAELQGAGKGAEAIQSLELEGGGTGNGIASWNGLVAGALQTFCLYLHGETDKALEAAERTEQSYFTHYNSFIAAEWPFIYGLVLAKACFECAPGERPAHIGLLKQKSAMLVEMAEACAENFFCRSALLEAELARLEGRHWDAIGHYETAMESARQGGFVFVEALAAELAGGFWLEQGNPRMAAPHLQRAFNAYEAWGAHTKSGLLKTAHPGLLAGFGVSQKDAGDSLFYDRLEIEAIMEAAGVISGEMEIKPLLQKLMRVLLKNAGAQIVCFLLAHDEGLVAAASAQGGEVRVFMDNPPDLDSLEGVAPGIVRYAARTGEAVVLDDAALDGRFRHEFHMDGRHPRSVLCVPVRRQGELFGVVYFENNLLSGVFTPERLETVRMLASQAAIALENARLYEDLSAHARRIGEAYDSLQTEVKQRKEAERRAHMLAQKIISAQEQERRRIALDLHDNVAQNLSLSRILCQTMRKWGEISPDGGSKELQRLTELIQQAIDDVRGMAYELRPPALEQFGLIRALDDYCRDFADSCSIGIEFMAAGMENAALDTEKEINIYRLVQEALNNIQKHAKAKRAWVKIVMSEPDVLITVRDDGAGFDVDGRGFQAAGKEHMGLQGMMERAGLLGGEFSVRSVKNKGTIVSIKIPCR
jgi:signal transduction histidine kinase